MKQYTACCLQNTYERSKLCLLEEHRRKTIHQDILVVNDESIAFSQPWQRRAELGITCILEHLVELEGEGLMPGRRLPQLLPLLLHGNGLGWCWCRIDHHATKNKRRSVSAAYCSNVLCSVNCSLLLAACSLQGTWLCVLLTCALCITLSSTYVIGPHLVSFTLQQEKQTQRANTFALCMSCTYVYLRRTNNEELVLRHSGSSSTNTQAKLFPCETCARRSDFFFRYPSKRYDSCWRATSPIWLAMHALQHLGFSWSHSKRSPSWSLVTFRLGFLACQCGTPRHWQREKARLFA